MREYIDIINELNRRDFLKGVGGAAAMAATGAASASIPINVPIPSYEETDPPLPRKVKMVWNYFKKSALDDEDLEHITRLVYLMYIARMTKDSYRDSQGGRIVGKVSPSEIYKTSYDLIVFINDSFLDLRIDILMNKTKTRFEQMQKNDPTRWSALQEQYFKTWQEIIARGKILKQSLTKDSEKEPESEVNRAADSGPVRPGFEGKMIDTGLVLFVYARLNGHESLPKIKSAIQSYIAKTGLGKEINRRIKEIQSNPSQFGPSTKPEQYFRQADQIINDIRKL